MSEGQIPGSGETMPKPVSLAMPTQLDHTPAAAGAAGTSSGRTGRSWASGPDLPSVSVK